MSNGNDGPSISGINKRMQITIKAEGYADVNKEWNVPEELVRPYALAFDAGIAALGVKISKAMYDMLVESGLGDTAENFLAKTMLEAAE